MTAEQVSLFGEIGGLFEPEMLACTPPEQVELIPGDHVAAMRAADPGLCPPPCERPTLAEAAYLASIEHAKTAAPAPDDEPDRWTPTNLPTLGDLVRTFHAPWLILDCLDADDNPTAVARLKYHKASSGSGGPRGHLTADAWGEHLLILTGHGDDLTSTRHRIASWSTIAGAIRLAATTDEHTMLAYALDAERAISDEAEDDDRPWLNGDETRNASPETLAAFELADAAWFERQDDRFTRSHPHAERARLICDAIADRIDAQNAQTSALF